MNCQEVRHLLEPYSDRELELIRHIEIESHLTQCAECAEQDKRLNALRAAAASPSLYFPATEALRERLQLPVIPSAATRSRSAIRRASICAGLLLAIGISFTLGWRLPHAQNSTNERIAESVVANHVRSLQVDHLIDVASSDQHTVKPWFMGKLEFSPHVPDLSAQGYQLAGGRLDYLAERPIAAVVYYLRGHGINVLTWPSRDEEENVVRSQYRHGFHIRFWESSGMSYWVISDLNDQELDDFVRLFRREQTPELHH